MIVAGIVLVEDYAVDPVAWRGQEGSTRAKESVLNAAISWKVKPR